MNQVYDYEALDKVLQFCQNCEGFTSYRLVVTFDRKQAKSGIYIPEVRENYFDGTVKANTAYTNMCVHLCANLLRAFLPPKGEITSFVFTKMDFFINFRTSDITCTATEEVDYHLSFESMLERLERERSRHKTPNNLTI